VKLFILGHARHGKDTVAEMICANYEGWTFESSSHIACEHVVMPYLKEKGLTYNSVEDAYADRMNHRMDWYHAIKAYNTPNLRKLSHLIFDKHDIYVGIRDREEFLACKDLSDLAIWVDAYGRVPADDPTCKILPEDADVIISNRGSLKELERRVVRLMDALECRICIEAERT
jgi:hypothetical protein